VSGEAFVYRTNSLVNQFVAAKAGIGLALLPCYLGDDDSDLARALPMPVPDLAGELWIVTHADLKGTARVRAFFDLVGEGLAREHNLFEGQGRSRWQTRDGSTRRRATGPRDDKAQVQPPRMAKATRA
jgi:hypothetical protein